jgi:hypothetical protein
VVARVTLYSVKNWDLRGGQGGRFALFNYEQREMAAVLQIGTFLSLQIITTTMRISIKMINSVLLEQ